MGVVRLEVTFIAQRTDEIIKRVNVDTEEVGPRTDPKTLNTKTLEKGETRGTRG